MSILVVGASGATGRLLVKQLLDKGKLVKAVVRSPEKLPDDLRKNDRLSVIHAVLLDLSDDEMRQQVSGCTAVASCLGHNLTFKGIYGQPRRLVTDAVRRLCNAIKANDPEKPVRFVLMNTTVNSNRDVEEPMSFAQKVVIGLFRLTLPLHVDNEMAADYLRTDIGQHDRQVEWVAVRPDGLLDQATVTEYDLFPSPIRSAIFDAGTTSRINVANFMARLMTQDALWNQWKGQMPVIYNRN